MLIFFFFFFPSPIGIHLFFFLVEPLFFPSKLLFYSPLSRYTLVHQGSESLRAVDPGIQTEDRKREKKIEKQRKKRFYTHALTVTYNYHDDITHLQNSLPP